MSDFSSVMQALEEKAKNMNPFGKYVKFMLDEHVAILNGHATPPSVQIGDGHGDIVLKATLENFEKMLEKKLNPSLAFMSGKIKIEGDLQSALPLMKMF